MNGRASGWLERHPLHAGGISVTQLTMRVGKRFLDTRVMGLAAEMTYYALLSLFPLIGALGASLGFLERFVGPEQTQQMEVMILASLDLVFSREVTADIVAPLVQGLLQEERTGFAIGSFAMSLFLASRIFRSAIDTLDSAYHVEERRTTIQLWSLGLLFSVSSVIVSALLVSMVVVGPLLGGGHAIATSLRLGTAFEWFWMLARWPVVLACATGFLSLLYRFGPNVRASWRQSVPGAVFGMFALILVAIGFRVYVGATGLQSPVITDADDAVALALQAFGALMAALLWMWLSAMVVLTGGVFNAELNRLRGTTPPPATDESAPSATNDSAQPDNGSAQAAAESPPQPATDNPASSH
ncbi:YihY/virulence factor BrkB family protein [soil metagenome]